MALRPVILNNAMDSPLIQLKLRTIATGRGHPSQAGAVECIRCVSCDDVCLTPGRTLLSHKRTMDQQLCGCGSLSVHYWVSVNVDRSFVRIHEMVWMLGRLPSCVCSWFRLMYTDRHWPPPLYADLHCHGLYSVAWIRDWCHGIYFSLQLLVTQHQAVER